MKKINKFINEFKEFLLGSTFIDVAIGLLIAGAVKDVATSFTDSFITPIIMWILSALGANPDVTQPTTILGIDFYIQPFITSLITFIIIMFVAFTILKIYASSREKFKKEIEAEEEAEVDAQVQLLTEIRDLLKK